MSTRVRRTLIAVLLAVAVVGVVAVWPGSQHSGSKLVATRGGRAAARTASIQASGNAAQTADTTDVPTTTDPGTGTGVGTPVTLPPTSTSVAGPPTTKPAPGTTTVPPTSTTLEPAGPATGRLVVTLGVVTANGVQAGGGIAVMNADGSNRRVLVAGNYTTPQWTPDGRIVMFSSTDSYDTWTVAAGGGTPTQTPSDVTGTLSPDGTRVVHWTPVLGSTAPIPFSVQPVAETASGLVATGSATSLGVSGFSPVWSPDGRRIVYSTEIGPFADLAIVNADGTGRHDLLASTGVKAVRTTPAGFSADGSTIAFVGSDNRADLIDADGQNLRGALPDAVPGITNLGAFDIAWSLDHQRLAVLVDGGRSIVVVDGDRHLRGAIHLPVQGFPIGIAFDASGRDVYYMGSAESPPQVANLYSIALDGSRSHRLAGDGSLMVVPAVTR